jgi:DtxR family transcriptional regulator, Mn-dependent transcriptional regulator
MKRQTLTQAIEDYLKIIYELTAASGRASTTDIADQLDIKPASVTGMIQKLAATEPPLVEYQKHQGVVLTPEGERVALEIIRHHRLLEHFLHETLGFPWDEVHEEADRLEHVISEEFEERIAQVLGNPKYDPHGDPIPGRDLRMPPFATLCLAELKVGQRAIVRRVRDTNPDLLRYLAEKGVVPEARFEVIEYSPFDDNIRIMVEGRAESVVLGPNITCQIFVEVES